MNKKSANITHIARKLTEMNSLNGKNRRGKIGNVKTKQKKGKNKIMHKIKKIYIYI